MSKHRSSTAHRRKIAIAALAVAAVGVPSAAMASQSGAPARSHFAHARSHSATPEGSPSATSAGSPSATSAGSPSATPAGSPSAAATDQQEVVDLVNSERGKAGCEPLTVNEKLTKAAQDHSEDMAAHGDMSHTGSDGSSPGDRIERAGYSWRAYGENVAYGYDSPKSVMAGWMNSSGHKANILNCDFKEIGVGLAQPGNYWTQDFGTAR
ncbi:CAP domain-containing protein [Streptomyces sp. DR7-3]|uniref:CAP domain-containing protein n=1 Tax=Streptomyces malaysiensis TaxID=92644 RepID=UPI0020448CDB|nr:CAP domain-containing protein [Streptomyces sp. DR7-3]MCM3804738.1 CAP domain-containing protein [Streptomyces sp. DR7-3]